jgi:hypothetical protein
MKANFSITVDVDRDLVRMTMSGFFDAADVARFVAERDRAHTLLRSRANQHITLVDMRAMEIQSQENVARFQVALHKPATMSRRIAFVIAKSLARIQIRRAAEGREAGYFMSMEEAEAWLFSSEAAIAA